MVPICYRGFLDGSAGKESACNAGDTGSGRSCVYLSIDPMWSIPGSGRSPGGGNSNPLQYSSMKNPMDRGAWRTTIHGVAKNRTWLINQIHLFKSPYCLSSDYLIKSKVLALPSKTHHHLAWPLFLVLPTTIPYHEHDSQTTCTTHFLTIFLLSTTLISWWPRSEMPSPLFYITLNIFLKILASFLGWPIAVWVFILVLPFISCMKLGKWLNCPCLWFIIYKIVKVLCRSVMKSIWVILCRDPRETTGAYYKKFANNIIIII